MINASRSLRTTVSFLLATAILWINKKLTIKITVSRQVAHALHRLINRCEQQSLEPQNAPG